MRDNQSIVTGLAGLAAVTAAAACTTLGPVPATTGVSAMPATRPDAEVQLGVMPGYFLSGATVESPDGAGINQISAMLEPDRLIGVPGLIIGGRVVGPEHDNQAEPLLGYRRTVDAERRLAVAGLVHGTHASGTRKHASYEVTRFGAELAGDLRIGAPSWWIDPHLVTSLTVAAIDAEGSYCLDADGKFGAECPAEMPTLQAAEASGFYPALTAGIALHAARDRDGVFHGGRLLFVGAIGAMPRVLGGEQTSTRSFVTLGVALSLAVGAR